MTDKVNISKFAAGAIAMLTIMGALNALISVERERQDKKIEAFKDWTKEVIRDHELRLRDLERRP